MKTALLLLALAALAGCESVVTVTPPAYTPRLSLSYTLSNQPPIYSVGYYQTAYFGGRNPFAGTSQGILVNKNLGGRADARIELRDAGGQVVEEFRPDTSRDARLPTDYRYGTYAPMRGYVGVPGQAYLLRASAPGVEAVEATMTLPPLPAVEAVSFVPQPIPANINNFATPKYYGQLTFAIPDPVATADYYVAYAQVLNAAGQYWGNVFEDEGPRTTNGPTVKLNEFKLSLPTDPTGIMPISDAGRQGQRLVYSAPVGLYYGRGYDSRNPPPPAAYLELTVSSIPASTYDFYQSVQRYRDANDNPFAEPAPLRSNVRGGYGLFGGASDVVVRIKL